MKDTFISSFSFTGYDLRNLVVIFLLFFISGLLIPQYIYAQSDVEIPEWIRGMVKFYADGDVSDKEFTAAIEHLIKIGVIKSPQLSIVNDEEEHMRQVTGVQNDVVVPIWIKNNARWYADGAISASDFARGIEFMVEEKIISSPNISVEPKPEKSSDIQTGSNNLDSTAAKLAFEVQKWNELSMWWLVNIKSAEVDILDEAAEQAWKKYSEEKNTDLMKVATDLENAARKANNDANRAVEIHKTAMKLAGDAKQVAISEGNHVLDLENDVKEQQKDFEFDQKISSVEDVENRISVTKTLQKETSDKLKELQSKLSQGKEGNVGYEELAKIGQILNNDGSGFVPGVVDPQIIEGHEMILESDEDWEEIQKLLDDVKGLPGFEEEESDNESALLDENDEFAAGAEKIFYDTHFTVYQYSDGTAKLVSDGKLIDTYENAFIPISSFFTDDAFVKNVPNVLDDAVESYRDEKTHLEFYEFSNGETVVIIDGTFWEVYDDIHSAIYNELPEPSYDEIFSQILNDVKNFYYDESSGFGVYERENGKTIVTISGAFHEFANDVPTALNEYFSEEAIKKYFPSDSDDDTNVVEPDYTETNIDGVVVKYIEGGFELYDERDEKIFWDIRVYDGVGSTRPGGLEFYKILSLPAEVWKILTDDGKNSIFFNEQEAEFSINLNPDERGGVIVTVDSNIVYDYDKGQYTRPSNPITDSHSYLVVGEGVLSPDQMEEVKITDNSDGSKTYDYESGKRIVVGKDGTTHTYNPETINVDGVELTKDPDGFVEIVSGVVSLTGQLENDKFTFFTDQHYEILHKLPYQILAELTENGEIQVYEYYGSKFEIRPNVWQTGSNMVSYPNGETWVYTDEGEELQVKVTKNNDGTTFYDYPDGTRIIEDQYGQTSTIFPESDNEPAWITSVLIINGIAYPGYQFVMLSPDACAEDHYHTAFGSTVYSIDLVPLEHPSDPCGFGTVSQISFDGEWPITESQALAWEEMFNGLDIREGQYTP